MRDGAIVYGDISSSSELPVGDFLGYDSVIQMAADHLGLVERALTTRKAGNRLLEVIGGRAEHPVNSRTGGFYRAPTRDELEPLQQALEDTLDTVA